MNTMRYFKGLFFIYSGAFARKMSGFNIVDHPLESVDYNCSGSETSLSACPTSSRGFCDTAATVQCQGKSCIENTGNIQISHFFFCIIKQLYAAMAS